MSKNIKDLFIDELHDILSAEHQITKALPKMAAAAHSPELKKAFLSHLEETHGQVERLNKIFKLLKLTPKEKLCKATKGLIQEGQEILNEYEKSPVRDAGLISKAQRIEHYEISAYGTLCTFAKELGLASIATLLHQSFNEESNADKKLSKLAKGSGSKGGINQSANVAPATKAVKKAATKIVHAKSASVKTTTVKKVVAKAPAIKAAPVSVHTKAPAKKTVAKATIAKKAPASKVAVKKTVAPKVAPKVATKTAVKATVKKTVVAKKPSPFAKKS